MIHIAFRDEAAAIAVVEAWAGVPVGTATNGRFLDTRSSLFDFESNDFAEDEPSWAGFACLVSVVPNRKSPGWDNGVEEEDARAVFDRARADGVSCILIGELTETIERFDAPVAAE